MESGIVFAGVLVVLGLLMESWPELQLAWSEGRFPKLPVTGGIIVTLGVLIEVVLGIFITQRANRIQSRANERISIAEKATAEALERAANAEKAAAEANLERERLARRFAYRTLTADVYRNLLKALSPLAGTRLDVFAFDSHKGDVWSFANELTNVSKRAGLDCTLWFPPPETPRILAFRTDVVFASAKECTPEENELSSSLSMAFAEALARAGITIRLALHDFSLESDLPGFSPFDPSRFAPFRIQIVEREFLDSSFGS